MENFFFSLIPNNQICGYYSYPTEQILTQASFYTKQTNYSGQDTQVQNYQMLKLKYQQLWKQNQELKERIAELNTRQAQTPKRVVKRRKDEEIQKEKKCPYQNCKKWYGSQMALNLHMKEKHNGGSKKERQELAKKILIAQKNHEPTPSSQIALPPGFLQNFKKQLLQQLNNNKDLLGQQESHQNPSKKLKRQNSQ